MLKPQKQPRFARRRTLPQFRLALLCLLMVPAMTGCISDSNASSDAQAAAKAPPHVADSKTYRHSVALHALREFFNVKEHPRASHSLLQFLPQSSEPVALVNPGFNFTHNNGEPAPKGAWIILVNEGSPGNMQRHGKSLGPSDLIQGWTADGCAGVEATQRFHTLPDGPTGYMVAHGKDYTLHQTLKDQLKPSTRYTFLVEVYARKDYKAVKANEIILDLTDGENNKLQSQSIDIQLDRPDPETGFAVAILSITTTADQPEGDLRLHLGFNAQGSIRVNYDNARLWQQSIE